MITNAAIIPMRHRRGQGPAVSLPPVHVLSDRTLGRLQALNAVARRLRGWGIEIIGEDIAGRWPAEGYPTITIRRDPCQSIRPLLDAVGRVTWIRLPATVIHGLAILDTVRITWEEPR